MSRDITNSALFRLIEAGHLARRALQAPLADAGLQAGDDAILFLLKRKKLISEQTLCQKTGLSPEQLYPRMERLLKLSLVCRPKFKADGFSLSRLSKKGCSVRNDLFDRWRELDGALMGELKPKQRRKLKKNLERFVELLVL